MKNIKNVFNKKFYSENNTIHHIFIEHTSPAICLVPEFDYNKNLNQNQYQHQDSADSPLINVTEENLNNFYIIFDINPVEGFNLRRDVYVRLVVFIKRLRATVKSGERIALVLPPFQKLYHWKTTKISQSLIFWNHFFDLKSLQKYTNVLDVWEFFNEYNQWQLLLLNKKRPKENHSVIIDNTFSLENFADMFENGQFVEKFAINNNCSSNGKQKISIKNTYLGYNNITSKSYQCVNYQGNVMLLQQLFEKHVKRNPTGPTIVLVQHAETVLHDYFGNAEFWQARRSMRFNSYLTQIANAYRKDKFNSTDIFDNVQRPLDWRNERLYRKAIGGNYICGHLRRSDFLHGREKTTPSIRSTAYQIKSILNQLNTRNVYISSDCSKEEYKLLRSHLQRYNVYKFFPESLEQMDKLKDGGLAIIDQIICSNAMYFIGTYESTFTYRIYEEREILGFPKNVTFNTFCKYDYDLENCSRNSKWPIVYN